MKYLLLILFALSIYSCSPKNDMIHPLGNLQNQDIDSGLPKDTLKSVIYNGFTINIPFEFPNEVFELSPNDLENISNSSSGKNLRGVSGNSFDEIVQKIRKKYPDFDNFDPKNYKKFFPKLSHDEIVEKQEEVLSYVEALMGYEVAISVAQAQSKNGRTVFSINYEGSSCEMWYYAGHLRLDEDGLKTAKNKAEEYGGFGYQNKSDANRHATWNVYMGKYAAYRYSTVDKVKEVVKGFSDAHEQCGPGTSEDHAMDYHNNSVGIEYLGTIAERYKAGFLNYNVRVNTRDQDIYDYVNGLPTVLKTTVSEINSQNNSTLVKSVN
jgi:hypothetical protein